MYSGGKLTAAARSRLEKRYAKERAKDSILRKIDAKQKKNTLKKKRVKTTNSIKPTTSQSSKRPVQEKPAPAVPTTSADPLAEEDDCPDTPPRNDMVRERDLIMKQNKGVNWISLALDVQETAKAEKELYENLEQKSKDRCKKSLEEQMAIREKIREQEKQKILQEQLQLKEQFKKWEQEDAAKAQKRHQKIEELKKMREEQIQLLDMERAKYEKKERRREARAARKAEQERLAHEKELLDKKERTKREMRQVLEENAKHKQVVLAEQQKQMEEDIRLQVMYAKMLDEQAAKRAKRLADTYAQAEQKVANLLDCTAEERRKIEEAERRSEQQLLERQAADDERRRAKADRLHREAMEIQDFLRAQMQAKEDALREEIERDIAYGDVIKANVQKAEEAEVLKVSKRKECNNETSQYIRDQIAARKERSIRERADMNNEEKLMNMSLIRKIESGEPKVKEPEYDPKRPFSWRYNYRSKPF